MAPAGNRVADGMQSEKSAGSLPNNSMPAGSVPLHGITINFHCCIKFDLSQQLGNAHFSKIVSLQVNVPIEGNDTIPIPGSKHPAMPQSGHSVQCVSGDRPGKLCVQLYINKLALWRRSIPAVLSMNTYLW